MDLIGTASIKAAQLLFKKLQHREIALCLAREESDLFTDVFKLALKVNGSEFYLVQNYISGAFFPPQVECQLPKIRVSELHRAEEIIKQALWEEIEHHLKSFRFTLLFENEDEVVTLWSTHLALYNCKKPAQNFTVQQLAVDPFVVYSRFRSSFEQKPAARAFLSEQEIWNINVEARHILRDGVNPIGFLGSSALG